MTNLEIKTQLESILSKVDANRLRAWNYDFEAPTEAIAIEDHYGDEDINSPSDIIGDRINSKTTANNLFTDGTLLFFWPCNRNNH